MKKYLWAICFGVTLVAFTAYAALNTFVLSAAYQTDATQMNTAMFAAPLADNGAESLTPESSTRANQDDSADNGVLFSDHQNDSDNNTDTSTVAQTENSYTADGVSITLTEYYENNTRIYVADVTLSTTELLKTAFADDTYGKNVTDATSSIAEAHDAILAINGDYYGVQENGYVIRNGVVYRDAAKGSDVLCIMSDGTMQIVSDTDYTADELVNMGVWQALTFGPALIENSQVTVGVNDEVGRAMASNPRTAIGMIDQNHFVFVVSDGRTSESEGLSLYELGQFMQSLGVTTAYNLDGGGSSTMYFNGQVVNNPTSGRGGGSERGVSDIVYIG